MMIWLPIILPVVSTYLYALKAEYQMGLADFNFGNIAIYHVKYLFNRL